MYSRVPPRYAIPDFGRGRVTFRNATKIGAGAARDSLNFDHDRGIDSAEKRTAINRAYATRPANARRLNVFEYVPASGSKVYISKVGAVMYGAADLDPATTETTVTLQSGMDATHPAQMCTAGNMLFVTDWAADTYISNGTAAVTHTLQKTGPVGTVTLAARVGTAVGNTALTISYYQTDVEPTTGEETPPSAATTIVRGADEGVAITGLTYTATYTTKRIYRNAGGTTQPYRVVTLAASATTFRERTTNVATLTTAAAHSLQVGQSVTISGVGGSGYNVTADVASTPTTTTFTYANVAGNEASTADTGGTVYKAGYLDDTLDSSTTAVGGALSTASEVHDSDGVASIEKPAAAKFCCFFRNRLFLANLSGFPSRIRWSKVDAPTQFSNASTAYQDVGVNDGGVITGIVPFRGSIVIFKTNSIWIMNGDVDEVNFTFFEAVPGRGCVAPWTIRRDGDNNIFFLSAQGVLTFDLSSVPQIPLSDPIGNEIADLVSGTREDFFVAGIDPTKRQYLLSVTPTGQTTNTKTHVYHFDTGAWGRIEWGMGKILPSCYSDTGQNGPLRNAAGQVKLFVGDENGYLYETDTTAVGDGVTSGTHEATVTGATATTTTATAAAFRTTGNGLTGLPMTVRRAADSTYETVEITSNTATVITHPALSGTAIAVNDTVFIGAIQATLSLGRLDLGTVAKKRWIRLEAEFEKQTATTPLRLGYTLDGDTAPTVSSEFSQAGGYSARWGFGGNQPRSIGLSPYFDIIGTNYSCELLRIFIEAEVLGVRLPSR